MTPTARCVALVPAAGSGARMGSAQPKQYLALCGQALLLHTLAALLASPALQQVAVVLSPEDGWFDALTLPLDPRLVVLRCGGASRAETVRNGLLALPQAEDDWVLVHDAARPCLQAADTARLIAALQDDPVGGLLALPVADTLKRADAAGRVAATVPREQLWRAQTPQMFRYGLLLRALSTEAGAQITDEASAIERLGLAPRLVLGSERNIKVTYPHDLALAARWLEENPRYG